MTESVGQESRDQAAQSPARRPPLVMERSIRSDVGGGASGFLPHGDLEGQLRYGSAEAVRLTAASVVSTFASLLSDTFSDAHAVRMLKLMRNDMRQVRRNGKGSRSD